MYNLQTDTIVRKDLTLEQEKTKERTVTTHGKKLRILNKEPAGQDYQSLKTKRIHNISSYVLTPAEERISCRGWEFCIENKINNFIEFKTNIELNMKKIEHSCHRNAFSTICCKIFNASDILMKLAKKKNIRNISDEEFKAIKSLKANTNIIICRAGKGNYIAILDKQDYINKAEEILKLKQFRHTEKSLLNEKEKSMNSYISKLLKDKIVDKHLYWRIHSTSSSLATMSWPT
ncbi:unnamed protein product [Rotaria socialis]|uniref:Uncharacterized protein n=1 Tax=Rotaria socialis TaxID=392032 RepID=A0A820HCU7_9BILA|nr:unnamed protein product [Rotaria socialis]